MAHVLALLASHDPKASLDVWKMDEVPACDDGMKLAQAFLISFAGTVDRLGFEDPPTRSQLSRWGKRVGKMS
jgi:hypothetical protein